MKKVTDCIDRLVASYEYKRLPKELSERCREFYIKYIPSDLQIKGDNKPLYTSEGTMIAEAYDRIVVGDYGAFIEISSDLICEDNLVVEKGQEYRFRKPYIDNVKYIWLTTKDNSHVKVYKQLRGVSYADYKPNVYYVSVYEANVVDIN